jgi:hypothetical protein
LVCFGWAQYRPGVTVTLKNAGRREITDVRIGFTGGVKSSRSVGPFRSFATRINPKGPSHLVVEFVDSCGNQHAAEADIYIEHNYRGAVDITVSEDGGVTWKENLRI